MPFSDEEELDKLLRCQVIRQPRNFQKSRLFDIANSRQFLEKFRLPVHALVHLLELVGPCLEHRNDTQDLLDDADLHNVHEELAIGDGEEQEDREAQLL